MWKLCRLGKCIAVFVVAVLSAGVLIQSVAAQTVAQTLAAACDPTKLAPNTNCKVSAPSLIVDAKGKPVLDANGNPQTVNQQVSVTNAYGTTPWQGLNWGIGIAADFDLGGRRVKAAQLDSANIVRVTDASSNVAVSFVLEAHYFNKEWFPFQGCQGLNCSEYALGPFIAIEVGGGSAATPSAGNNPITGYALGLLLGMHHPDTALGDTKLANSTWNFGVGLRVDPSAQVLADGVVANRPPPLGITAGLLTKTEPRYGLMLLSSFSF